jgi:hypothetical protein
MSSSSCDLAFHRVDFSLSMVWAAPSYSYGCEQGISLRLRATSMLMTLAADSDEVRERDRGER